MTDAIPETPLETPPPVPALPPRKRRRGATTARSRFGPYSKEGALATLDGRSAPARFLRNHKEELSQFCGGTPTRVEIALIDRAAWLRLKLMELEVRLLDGSMTLHDNLHYVSWSNSYTRTVATLRAGAEHARRRAARAEKARVAKTEAQFRALQQALRGMKR